MYLSLKWLLSPGGFNWIDFFRVIAYPGTAWPWSEPLPDKDQEAGQRRRRMLGWPNQRFSSWHAKQKPGGLNMCKPFGLSEQEGKVKTRVLNLQLDLYAQLWLHQVCGQNNLPTSKLYPPSMKSETSWWHPRVAEGQVWKSSSWEPGVSDVLSAPTVLFCWISNSQRPATVLDLAF